MPTVDFERKTGFFHAGAQRALTRGNMTAPFEATLPSTAVIFDRQVLLPGVLFPVPDFQSEPLIDAWIVNNPGILRKYTTFPLTVVPGTNDETWFIDDGGNGGRQAPILTEQFVVDPFDPTVVGQGLVAKLFQGVGGTNPGQQIPADKFFVQPDEGLIHFDRNDVNGGTPVQNNWGAVTMTCYVYIGPTLQSGAGNGKVNQAFTGTDTIVLSNVLDFSLIEIWVQNPPQFSSGEFCSTDGSSTKPSLDNGNR